MTEEPPDLNPGHKVGELAAAAQAAAQVGSMRRDAAARQQAEQDRAAADVAQEQRRSRAEWERLIADRERAQRRVDEARYDHGDAARAEALRQQRYDTLVLAQEDVAAAGPEKVSPAEQARLERDLHTADEGLDAARARAERAARALDSTAADYATAAAALDTFEQAHGIARAANAAAAVGAEDAAVHLAAQDGIAAQHELTTGDQVSTPLIDEHGAAQPEAHDHAGYQAVELADAQAAHAIELASRVTTQAASTPPNSTPEHTTAPLAAPAPVRTRRAAR